MCHREANGNPMGVAKKPRTPRPHKPPNWGQNSPFQISTKRLEIDDNVKRTHHENTLAGCEVMRSPTLQTSER